MPPSDAEIQLLSLALDDPDEYRRRLEGFKALACSTEQEPLTTANTVREGDEVVAEAASLSPIEYDRQRKQIAGALGIRIATLDSVIAAKRPKPCGNGLQGQDMQFEHVEPFAEEVDGAALLSEIAELFAKHIVLPLGASETLALWCMWTYLVDQFEIAPMLGLTSATKRCGKTRVLTILSKVVLCPLAASNISPAAIFRAVEKWHPTIMADEAESFFKDNEALRGILNSGHTKTTAYVIRCEGEDNEPRAFSTWGAKAWAAIGILASTLMDRSIVLPLRRCTPGEKFVKRLPSDDHFAMLRSRIVRWVNDNLDEIRSTEVVLPDGLDNRAEDNWAPLFAIAQVAGEGWPTTARQAAQRLSGVESEDAREVGVQLLHDIRRVFDERGVDRLHTDALLGCLCAMGESPWPTYCHGKPLTPRALANLLRPFEIRSKQLRIDDKNQRGFEAGDFTDAWLRYPAHDAQAPREDAFSATSDTPQENQGFASDSEVLHAEACNGYECSGDADEIRTVTDVIDKGGEAERTRALSQSLPPKNGSTLAACDKGETTLFASLTDKADALA